MQDTMRISSTDLVETALGIAAELRPVTTPIGPIDTTPHTEPSREYLMEQTAICYLADRGTVDGLAAAVDQLGVNECETVSDEAYAAWLLRQAGYVLAED